MFKIKVKITSMKAYDSITIILELIATNIKAIGFATE